MKDFLLNPALLQVTHVTSGKKIQQQNADLKSLENEQQQTDSGEEDTGRKQQEWKTPVSWFLAWGHVQKPKC